MKPHSNLFTEQLLSMGREIKSIVTYQGSILEDELYHATPLYEGNLLKSVMKQLDLETSVELQVGDTLQYELGVKVNGVYEYLDFGNYVIESIDKQEDTDLWLNTCYDKMIYSMKPYEAPNIVFPCSVRSYYEAIASKIGLQVENTHFNNETQLILAEPYEGIDCTFRDVLDDLAEVAGGIIRISQNDKLEVIYPTETNEIIDEEFFSDTNVTLSKKIGPINSIVLSRSAGSDNVFLQDYESVAENGLCEFKIVDNQIMNFNNRSNFLQGILDALDGLEFYLNDMSTKGILYLELGDLYDVSIRNNTYRCLMLNDEIEITQGIAETLHADLPETAETDYTKADKTDMRLNQTTLIVDKQNQKIEAVVTSNEETVQRVVQLTADVNEIKQEISDIADITESKEGYTSLSFEDINTSEPIQVKIRPIAEDLLPLYPNNTDLVPSHSLVPYNLPLHFCKKANDDPVIYPRNTLYPSNTLYPNGYEAIVEYNLPGPLLFMNSLVYDEFVLDYYEQECYILHRIEIRNGTKVVVPEWKEYFAYPTISLDEGDYDIKMPFHPNIYLFVRLMKKNIYTDQFATKVEMNTAIEQTATDITISVDEKLTNYVTETEMSSAISVTADAINSEVRKKVGKDEIISSINQSAEAVSINANKISLAGKTLNLAENMEIVSNNFNVDSSGNAKMKSINITNEDLSIQGDNVARINLTPNRTDFDFSQVSIVAVKEGYSRIALSSHYFFEDVWIKSRDAGGGQAGMYIAGPITATAFNPVSDAKLKTNIKEYKENALDTIQNSTIYEYYLKDTNKYEIGLVIGDKYKCADIIKEKNEDSNLYSINLYRMCSVMWKAIQEQQNQIEELKKEISCLKGETSMDEKELENKEVKENPVDKAFIDGIGKALNDLKEE